MLILFCFYVSANIEKFKRIVGTAGAKQLYLQFYLQTP